MTKLKLFFTTSALLLMTVVVFSGRPKFIDFYRLYGYNPSFGYVQLASSATSLTPFDEWQVSPLGTAPVMAVFWGISYGLYYYDVTRPLMVAPRPITLR